MRRSRALRLLIHGPLNSSDTAVVIFPAGYSAVGTAPLDGTLDAEERVHAGLFKGPYSIELF
jgi:hypothetical protein